MDQVLKKLHMNMTIKKSLGAWQEFKRQQGKNVKVPKERLIDDSIKGIERKISRLKQNQRNTRNKLQGDDEPFDDLVRVKSVGIRSNHSSPK